mgnify:CR=1 FL=1
MEPFLNAFAYRPVDQSADSCFTILCIFCPSELHKIVENLVIKCAFLISVNIRLCAFLVYPVRESLVSQSFLYRFDFVPVVLPGQAGLLIWSDSRLLAVFMHDCASFVVFESRKSSTIGIGDFYQNFSSNGLNYFWPF